MNPNYEPRTLLAAFEQGPLSHTFLRDTFFPVREYPPTNLVEFDFRRGRRKMAPFVAPLVGGKVMERQGYETRFYRAPKIAPVRALRTPDLEARLPGENIYIGRTAADRAADLLAEDSIFLDEAITRREEWMCRALLINGGITVSADNGYTNVINYMESSAGAPNNHFVPTIKWDQTNSDPFADLEAARLAVIRDSGISPNIVLFGTTAKSAFLNNANVAKFLDSIRFSIATIKPTIVDEAVVFFGSQAGLEYYSYAEYFEDDAGTLYPMLPPELVLLASTRTPNKIVYGAVTQLEDAKAKRFVTYQSPRVPFVYGEEDDGNLFYRLTASPLPMPVDVLGWRIVEAITGVSYPFPTPGSVPPEQPFFSPDDPEAAEKAREAAEKETHGKEGTHFFGPPAPPVQKGTAPDKKKGTPAKAGKVDPTDATDDENGDANGDNGDGLENNTVDQLKDIANDEDIDLSGLHRKDDIIKAIREHRKANE
jgi:hypothetical protein